MRAAGEAAVERLQSQTGIIEIEAEMSHVAADVIFRTLFSIPIEHRIAQQVFIQFRDYQRTQPILNLAAFVPVPRWMPRFHRRRTKESARTIRALITELTSERMHAIQAGKAPDDLATKIMTMADPETGETFSTEEMVDQVTIFFLAGHETSASALSWTLYLLTMFPEVQERVAAESRALDDIQFGDLSKLSLTRDVFREALRLYPPVPMMVRKTTCPEQFRERDLPQGSQVVLSPWHLHRHERIWDRPGSLQNQRGSNLFT